MSVEDKTIDDNTNQDAPKQNDDIANMQKQLQQTLLEVEKLKKHNETLLSEKKGTKQKLDSELTEKELLAKQMNELSEANKMLKQQFDNAENERKKATVRTKVSSVLDDFSFVEGARRDIAEDLEARIKLDDAGEFGGIVDGVLLKGEDFIKSFVQKRSYALANPVVGGAGSKQSSSMVSNDLLAKIKKAEASGNVGESIKLKRELAKAQRG